MDARKPFRASEMGPVVGEVLGHKAAAGGNADDESGIETGRAQGELPCRQPKGIESIPGPAFRLRPAE
jgi:hypothetical protein